MKPRDRVHRRQGHRCADDAGNRGTITGIDQRGPDWASTLVTVRSDDETQDTYQAEEFHRIWWLVPRWEPDALSWWPDIPRAAPSGRPIRTLDTAETRQYRYRLAGSAGRWFIIREPAQPSVEETVLRTRFFPNQRIAYEVFVHLAFEA
ncbi:hypothetical protein [Actinoallomurus acaciae]|uniref:Uncharacterized protein n=1 Tax=Actinoallomurus acaciae TaxID=502577 RepID=A0ABV5YCT4_9ACTN